MNRQIGLWSATALVVASMIGTGVFTTSGFLIADLHSKPLVIGAWAIGGLIAICGAISYGALARLIPESGGEYLFLARTIHPAAGYLAGWTSLLVGFSAPLAAASLAFGEYTQSWFGGADPRSIGTVLLLVLTIAHEWDVRAGAWVQNLSVLVKLMFLLIFLVLGTSRTEIAREAPAVSAGLGAFAVALVWISFSYSGWNAAIYISSEIRDAPRTVPRAMILGTGVVLMLYVAINFVVIFSTPADALAGQVNVARIAARHLGGPNWENAVTAVVALALGTSVSSIVMAGPRVYARMAADGYLPRVLIPGGGAPRAAIAFQTGIALALLWTATFKALLTYIGFTLSLSTAAAVFGLMKVRITKPGAINVFGWPWIPVIYVSFVLFTGAFAIVRQPLETGLGGATLLCGLIAYQVQKRARGEGPNLPR